MFSNFSMYLLILFSLIQFGTVFYLIKSLREDNLKTSIKLFIWALLSFSLVTITASILSILMTNILILFLAIILACFVQLIFILMFTKQKTIENLEQVEIVEQEKQSEIAINQQRIHEIYTKVKEFIPIGNQFLTHVIDTIRRNNDPADAFSFINKTVIDKTGADGGALILIDDFEDILVVKAFEGAFPPPYELPGDFPRIPERVSTNFKYAEFKLDDSLLGSIALGGKPLIIEDGTKDSRIPQNGEEEFLIPGSYLFIPLLYNEKVTGIIALSRNSGKAPFIQTDLETGETLAAYVAGALNVYNQLQEESELSVIENESDIVNKIQKILIPKKIIDTKNLSFGIYFNQARGVCSDYYDVIKVSQERAFVILTDVAGKSVQSAIIMTMIRAIVYLVTNVKQTTEATLSLLNKGIIGKVNIDHYASVSLLTYFPEKKQVEFIVAGNQSILVWRSKTKKIEIFQEKTDPIGVDIESVYKSKRIEVEENDIIGIYSDGLIEALNKKGAQFGIKTVSNIIAESHTQPVKKIAETIREQVKTFMGKTLLHDDQTILLIKVKS